MARAGTWHLRTALRHLRPSRLLRPPAYVRRVITRVLVEHPGLTPLALLACLVVGPPLAWWLAGRQRLAMVLAALSLIPVAALTLSRTSRPMTVTCVVDGGLLSPLGAIEPMANLVLFVGPVLLLAVATGRPLLALIVGSGLSALIELTQAYATTLGRSCSTGDWIANTEGALLGAAIASLALLARRLPPPQRPAATMVSSSR